MKDPYWGPLVDLYCYIKSTSQFSDCLLDQDMFTVYEKIKAFYSEQLFIWGLWTQRLCVLKASSIQESERDREEHNSLKMTVDCSNDSEAVIDVTTDEHEVILQGKSRLQGVNALSRVPA